MENSDLDYTLHKHHICKMTALRDLTGRIEEEIL